MGFTAVAEEQAGHVVFLEGTVTSKIMYSDGEVSQLTWAETYSDSGLNRPENFTADAATVSATSSRPSIRRFLSSHFFICFPPFP